MKKLIIVLIGFLICPKLEAQNVFAGVEAGIAQNMIDLRSYSDNPINVPFTFRVGGGLPGLQIYLAYGIGLTKPKYVFKDEFTGEERFEDDFTISSFGGGLRLNTSRDQSVGFLMRAGIAQTKVKEKISTTNGEYAENNDFGKKLGFNFSIGLSIPLGKSFQMAIESEYAMSKLKVEDKKVNFNQWKILTVGVYYVFYSK